MSENSEKTNQIKADSEDKIDTINANSTPSVEPIVNSKSTSSAKKTDSLSGLLAHYNSDSEAEEPEEKLDVKVDSFLQEINDIKPVKPKNVPMWQECFDESTGYPYYWNVETNIVTWEMPPEYKLWLENPPLPKSNHSDPPIAPVSPKIVKVEIEVKNTVETIPEVKKEGKIVKNNVNRKKSSKKVKTKRPSSDSEDEKIVMITSFCEESSESETEEKVVSKVVEEVVKPKEPSPLRVLGPHVEDIPKENLETKPKEEPKKEIIECIKEEVDETVILARLRTKAKMLQELDGELPQSVNKLLKSLEKAEKNPSLSLVAGYGDDSDDEEPPPTLPVKIAFPIPETTEGGLNSGNAESTLFPITKPIDIAQFSVPEEEKAVPVETPTENLDTKVFKRKKRIAFDVLPSKKPKAEPSEDPKGVESSSDHKGFGFKAESDSEVCKTLVNFKKGVQFVKSESEPPIPEKAEDIVEEDVGKLQEIVAEKVNFLCEGKNEVSAVQIMSIQLKTLELAFKAGGLSEKYLYGWLRQTDLELGQLETEAAPAGWLCKWDRCNARYYYRHEASGQAQWAYPSAQDREEHVDMEMDIVGGAEAMDICTTPQRMDEGSEEGEVVSPRPEEEEEYQPPLPPVQECQPPPPPPPIQPEQPLPPGVEPEQLYVPIVAVDKRNSFGSELDSFYSDIALLEATTSSVPVIETLPESVVEEIEPPVKKKKKSKSKLGQGINMKKKAVSTLVEKWKKVQNDYM